MTNALAKYASPRTALWNPIQEMEEMQNRLASFFKTPSLLSSNGKDELMTLAQWAPLADISEDERSFTIKTELPEIKKEDVKIAVKDGTLSISGERKMEKEEKGRRYHRIERAYGSFLRSFVVPESASAEKTEAEFKDGVLTVRLPKDESAKPKSITIKVN